MNDIHLIICNLGWLRFQILDPYQSVTQPILAKVLSIEPYERYSLNNMHSATKPILVEISLNGTLFNFKPIPTHPDQILSVGNDHDVSVWSLTTGALVAKYKGTTNALVDATVHSDGKTFAYCSNDGILFVAYPDVR
jgi:WD40 repeat protein